MASIVFLAFVEDVWTPVEVAEKSWHALSEKLQTITAVRPLKVYYCDGEEDFVRVSSESELEDALNETTTRHGVSTLLLVVNSKQPERPWDWSRYGSNCATAIERRRRRGISPNGPMPPYRCVSCCSRFSTFYWCTSCPGYVVCEGCTWHESYTHPETHVMESSSTPATQHWFGGEQRWSSLHGSNNLNSGNSGTSFLMELERADPPQPPTPSPFGSSFVSKRKFRATASPNQVVTATWCVRNSGPKAWPALVHLGLKSATLMVTPFHTDGGVGVGEVVKFSALAMAPPTEGVYTAEWVVVADGIEAEGCEDLCGPLRMEIHVKSDHTGLPSATSTNGMSAGHDLGFNRKGRGAEQQGPMQLSQSTEGFNPHGPGKQSHSQPRAQTNPPSIPKGPSNTSTQSDPTIHTPSPPACPSDKLDLKPSTNTLTSFRPLSTQPHGQPSPIESDSPSESQHVYRPATKSIPAAVLLESAAALQAGIEVAANIQGAQQVQSVKRKGQTPATSTDGMSAGHGLGFNCRGRVAEQQVPMQLSQRTEGFNPQGPGSKQSHSCPRAQTNPASMTKGPSDTNPQSEPTIHTSAPPATCPIDELDLKPSTNTLASFRPLSTQHHGQPSPIESDSPTEPRDDGAHSDLSRLEQMELLGKLPGKGFYNRQMNAVVFEGWLARNGGSDVGVFYDMLRRAYAGFAPMV